MDFSSLVAPRIANERKRLGLSQEAAGNACGVSREMWGKYERGKAAMGTEVLYLFAVAGADATYILTGKSQQEAAVEKAAEVTKFAQQKLTELAPGAARRDEPAPPRPPTREQLARGTGLDPAWPQVLELVVDALIDHGRQVPGGRKLRELVDAVIVVLRLDEEGELDNEKLRRKIEAMV